jgi:hypothetical protein
LPLTNRRLSANYGLSRSNITGVRRHYPPAWLAPL